MGIFQSIRFCNRARTSDSGGEEGFVLLSALILAVLYLALIELLWMEGTRALQEAARYRARVVANVLAENGAELAAEKMVTSGIPQNVDRDDDAGSCNGTLKWVGPAFVLNGTGTSAGVVHEAASVRLQGRVVGTSVKIDYAVHAQ